MELGASKTHTHARTHLQTPDLFVSSLSFLFPDYDEYVSVSLPYQTHDSKNKQKTLQKNNILKKNTTNFFNTLQTIKELVMAKDFRERTALVCEQCIVEVMQHSAAFNAPLVYTTRVRAVHVVCI